MHTVSVQYVCVQIRTISRNMYQNDLYGGVNYNLKI